MADLPAPTFKKRTAKSTTAMRKRPAPAPTEAQSSSDSDSNSDNETSTRIKRRKTNKIPTSTDSTNIHDFSKQTKVPATRSTTITANDNATKSSTWYTDAALQHDPSKPNQPPKETSDPAPDSGTYKGTSTYGTFIQTNPDRKAVGPVKAPTNVRAITVTDFAPDVCKDYKQTGFCGFGDSCKFLHAREDYKQGWQLDKEWEKAGKSKDGKDGKPADLDDEEKLLAEIPFKCIICKGDYKMPVVTKCGHYFCEKCAMQRYMKGSKLKGCAQCGADTYGSFGVARKLKELLGKKEKREREREEREAEDA